MDSGISIKIIDRETIKYLVDNLENIDKDKAIRSGLRLGANLLKNGGKKRLKQRMNNPKGVKGELLNTFTIRVWKRRLGAMAGFRGDASGEAHLVDLGTADRFQIKTGRHTGAARATKFWTDTRTEDMSTANGMVMRGIERYVERVNNRL